MDEELLHRCPHRIPDNILEKARRFKRIGDRNNYIAGRWILFELCRQASVNHVFGELQLNSYGKPSIDGFMAFSVSHTDGLVAVAFSRNAIGLDAERFDPKGELSDFRNVFSKKEWEEIEEYGLSSFLRLWTMKEAVIKCLGLGIESPEQLQSINEISAGLVNYNGQHFSHNEFGYSDCMISTARIKSAEPDPPQTLYTCKISGPSLLLFAEHIAKI